MGEAGGQSVRSEETIRVQNVGSCFLCNSEGILLYQDLRDRILNTPGEWNLMKCSNTECGLLWLDPMPLEEHINEFYEKYSTPQEAILCSETWPHRAYQRITKGYLAHIYGYQNEGVSVWEKLLGMLIYFHPGRRADIDFSVMYLPAQIQGRLLDIGCGDGRMLRLMQELGWYVEGVDFDPVAVENAKNKGLKVRLGTLENQIYPDNHFDVITMSHLIEHVCDPLRLLLECYRILKPGGRLVVVTPNNGSWGHRIFRESWLHLDPPRHLYIFSLPSLRNIITKAGFQRARLSTIIRDANGTFLASRSIRHTGKHDRNNSAKRSIRIWARGIQLIEWAILKAKSDLGEEIALMAVK